MPPTVKIQRSKRIYYGKQPIGNTNHYSLKKRIIRFVVVKNTYYNNVKLFNNIKRKRNSKIKGKSCSRPNKNLKL